MKVLRLSKEAAEAVADCLVWIDDLPVCVNDVHRLKELLGDVKHFNFREAKKPK